jgi:hypothetical protein
MDKIIGPGETTGEDRFARCEEVLEEAFQRLVWEAVSAGWDEGEACVAIASLADHHILAMQSNEGVEDALKKLQP